MKYISPVVRIIITLVLLFLVFRETGAVTTFALLFVYLLLDHRIFCVRQDLEGLLASVIMIGRRVYGREVRDETEREAKKEKDHD